ncbi:MAG TPA: hypothetical protein VFV87_01230 [Pirellulaceae bacterium]|nr:hypothetical protein [Pirellulaceae bacterium]
MPGDGSCCDHCGWTLKGGGDDPRLPSNRSLEQIAQETNRRTAQRARMALDRASSYLREAIAAISILPDTPGNQSLHENAGKIEERIRHLQSCVRA